MKKPVVKSNNKTGQKFSFIDYSYSKQVVKDFPKILAVYEKLLPVLRQYQMYTGVFEVIQSVEDAKAYMQIQYDYYQHIYNTKGKINVDEK